jgi:hypothetical protein
VRRPRKGFGESGDFVDGKGKNWNHKGPLSREAIEARLREQAKARGKAEPTFDKAKKLPGEFDLATETQRVVKSVRISGENVVIDTRSMNAKDVTALKVALTSEGVERNVIFYP